MELLGLGDALTLRWARAIALHPADSPDRVIDCSSSCTLDESTCLTPGSSLPTWEPPMGIILR